MINHSGVQVRTVVQGYFGPVSLNGDIIHVRKSHHLVMYVVLGTNRTLGILVRISLLVGDLYVYVIGRHQFQCYGKPGNYFGL